MQLAFEPELAPKARRLASLRRALRAALKAQRKVIRRGMTLIEIMVVMALIGIIGVVVATNVIGAQQEGDIDAAGILVNTTVPNALTRYYSRKREFPESLQVLVDQNSINSKQVVDPWNTPLIYEPSGSSFRLCSAGPDRAPGNGDDICNNK